MASRDRLSSWGGVVFLENSIVVKGVTYILARICYNVNARALVNGHLSRCDKSCPCSGPVRGFLLEPFLRIPLLFS
jgi:hypothetical protein